MVCTRLLIVTNVRCAEPRTLFHKIFHRLVSLLYLLFSFAFFTAKMSELVLFTWTALAHTHIPAAAQQMGFGFIFVYVFGEKFVQTFPLCSFSFFISPIYSTKRILIRDTAPFCIEQLPLYFIIAFFFLVWNKISSVRCPLSKTAKQEQFVWARYCIARVV